MATRTILLERVYDGVHQKGYRVLVDRLWPRGVTKERAALDEWCKELAPSPALRKWFGHKPERWAEFQKKYEHELRSCAAAARALLHRASRKKLVLVYGAKDKEHTHALVLKKYLLNLSEEDDGPVDVASPVCYATDFDRSR